MLPCIVRDFFLNNQPDALIIQICYVIKLYRVLTLLGSGHQKTCMKLITAECTVENS